MKQFAIVLTLIGGLGLGGCSSDPAISSIQGGAIGAASGAAIGAMVGNPGMGAAIGAGVGVIGGFLNSQYKVTKRR